MFLENIVVLIVWKYLNWKNWLKVRFYLISFNSIFLVSSFIRYRYQFWLFIHYHRMIIRIRPRKSISLFMTLKLCFRTQFNYHLCPVMPGKRESVVNFWYLNALIIVSPILKGGKMDVSVDCWLLWWISWPKGLIKVHRAYNIDVEKRDKKKPARTRCNPYSSPVFDQEMMPCLRIHCDSRWETIFCPLGYIIMSLTCMLYSSIKLVK